jgi:hypothetical protein
MPLFWMVRRFRIHQRAGFGHATSDGALDPRTVRLAVGWQRARGLDRWLLMGQA